MVLTIDTEQLFKDAKDVLRCNWVELENGRGFTKPAACLYPFQWNWDSAFIVYGYAQYALEKGIEELRSLFRGQWDSGFLPHIVFHESDKIDMQSYFPGPDIWGVYSSQGVQTSGITQPPVVTMAAWRLYEKLREQDTEGAHSFLQEFYPKIFAFHKYLFTARDPEEWGIVTIYHPWESGLDNSPRWDRALQRIDPMDMNQFKRRDTACVAADIRPSDEDYGRYLQLVFELRERGYGDETPHSTFPFRVKDILFSSILYRANKRLVQIAEVLGEDTSEIQTWMDRFEASFFEKCWNEDDTLFYDIDLISGEQIRVHTVASLMPMITGLIDTERIRALSGLLEQTRFCEQEACKLAPSTSVHAEHFDHELYWRGPVWINMNWLFLTGLRECKMTQMATELKEGILKLVSQHGFWEYYSPNTGKGLGAENFSWSAALTIDLLLHH